MRNFSSWDRNYHPSEAGSSSGDTKGKTPVYDGVRRSAQQELHLEGKPLDLNYMIRWNEAAQEHQERVNEQLKGVSEIIQEIADINKGSANITLIGKFMQMFTTHQEQTNLPDNSELIQAKKV